MSLALALSRQLGKMKGLVCSAPHFPQALHVSATGQVQIFSVFILQNTEWEPTGYIDGFRLLMCVCSAPRCVSGDPARLQLALQGDP